MSLYKPSNKKDRSFNMTPLIDIVFLLIIFFLVVSQFIDAENFPVTVPDACLNAEKNENEQASSATLTVMKEDTDQCSFAVGAEKIVTLDNTLLVGQLTQLINDRLKNVPVDKRVVSLRIDKDIPFSQAQYALAAVAASTATDVQLIAIKDRMIPSQP